MEEEDSENINASYISPDGTRFYAVSLDGKNIALRLGYFPQLVMADLQKYFLYLYLNKVLGEVPQSMLIGPDAPLASPLTVGFSLEAILGKTASGKQRRTSNEEKLRSLLVSFKKRRASDSSATKQELHNNYPDIDASQMFQEVDRKTTLTANYINEHLPDKFGSALMELIMEATHYATREVALENGMLAEDIKGENDLVRDISLVVEQGVKRRLQTRRPGGSTSPYDFSRLDELYEQGKDLFDKAKKTLATLKHLPRKDQLTTLSNAYGQIEVSLITCGAS